MRPVPSSTRKHIRSAMFAALFLAAGAAAGGQLVVPGVSSPSASQQSPPAEALSGKSSFQTDLTGSTSWKDTGLDLAPGDSVEITASGQLQYPDATQAAGPEGLPRGWKDLMRILPVNDSGRGALLARIGDTEASRPFAVGARRQFSAPVAGRLFLGINQGSNEHPDGSFHVEVNILAHATGAAAQAASMGSSVPGFSSELLDRIPRRVADAQGDPGDMTNFILIGSEEELTATFAQAGWVQVDRTKKDAVLHGILASISKESYVQMPMSELYLFGRAQDYGFAMAVPYEVALQRHHNRVWKSPYTLNGRSVWVGAGTHDIGLERDQRNNGVTHKIDAAVDKERDFIADSLASTGRIAAKMYLRPSQPVGETKTATGGSFHSDGRVLVMSLRGAGPGNAGEPSFGAVFCSVLEREHPDAGRWGPCGEYLDAA
ncbi:MAG TPA: LssY C-terminal domain-containing protein, partial [Terriglobia bacterium]|nr:LssY C-terminal domain-containing protein [Terriglobia bacterium]